MGSIWDNLGDDDEAFAYRAAWELTNSTPSTVARLRDRLKPVAAVAQTKRIEALVRNWILTNSRLAKVLTRIWKSWVPWRNWHLREL